MGVWRGSEERNKETMEERKKGRLEEGGRLYALEPGGSADYHCVMLSLSLSPSLKTTLSNWHICPTYALRLPFRTPTEIMMVMRFGSNVQLQLCYDIALAFALSLWPFLESMY